MRRYSRELPLSLCANNITMSSLAESMQEVRVDDAAAPLPGVIPLPDAPAPLPGVNQLPDAPAPLPGALDPDNELWDDPEPVLFPVDCMQLDEVIPVLQSAAAVPGARIPALVSQVYSPSHFWLLIDVTGRRAAMDPLMDEMKVHYDSAYSSALHRDAMRVGYYCAALYEGDWHRAVIVDFVDWDNIKVRHIDYGTVSTVTERDLKPLYRRYAALPAQAVRARLAGVRPAGEATWTYLAFTSFFDSVCERTLLAEISAVDTEAGVLETFLFDTGGPEEVCLSAKLIREGHAVERYDSALRSEDVYLLPTFDNLESSGTSPPGIPSDADPTDVAVNQDDQEEVGRPRSNT